MGTDALYTLAQPNDVATAICTIGYYDGNSLLIASGTVAGSIVASKGNRGFGFDSVFVPRGQNKTYAEMSPTEKDAISHRSLAVKDLLQQMQI